MVSKKRIDTLKILVASHPDLMHDARIGDIVKELQKVIETKRVAGENRWLLQVLHTTRALDTCLSRVVANRGIPTTMPSLGGYLIGLRNANIIVEHQRSYWKNTIVDPRNGYMHSANNMPRQGAANSLLDEMDSCLAVVLARS